MFTSHKFHPSLYSRLANNKSQSTVTEDLKCVFLAPEFTSDCLTTGETRRELKWKQEQEKGEKKKQVSVREERARDFFEIMRLILEQLVFNPCLPPLNLYV